MMHETSRRAFPSLPSVSLLAGEVEPRAGSMCFLRASAGGRKEGGREGGGGGGFNCKTRAGEAQTRETGINNAAPPERPEQGKLTLGFSGRVVAV